MRRLRTIFWGKSANKPLFPFPISPFKLGPAIPTQEDFNIILTPWSRNPKNNIESRLVLVHIIYLSVESESISFTQSVEKILFPFFGYKQSPLEIGIRILISIAWYPEGGFRVLGPDSTAEINNPREPLDCFNLSAWSCFTRK